MSMRNLQDAGGGRRAGIGCALVLLVGVRLVAPWLVLGVLVALAGCAGQPAIAPEPRIVRVEVPVPVPCEPANVSEPAWAAAGLKRADSLEVKVRALLAERRQRMGYERELRAAVEGCQSPTTR